MEDFALYAVVALVLLLIIVSRKRLTPKTRLFAGVALSAFGWLGIAIGLAFGEQPAMQNQTVVYVWLGATAGPAFLGGMLLASGLTDIIFFRRCSRREKWPSN